MTRVSMAAKAARLVAALVAAAASACSDVLFFPSPRIHITPDEIGLVHDEVEFAATDGTTLHGWFLHARPVGPDPVPTVVYFHGNAGNVSTHLGGALWLPGEGFQVFLFDYRGFGRSGGKADLASAHADALAAVRLVAARDDVDRDRIVAVGQSIGGAIALTTMAALEREIPLRALVVDSAPSDFRGIAREKLAAFWVTWPLQWPLALTIPAEPSPLASAAAVADHRLLFVHGDRDSVVPPHHSFELAAAARGAELLLVPGAEHGQALELGWVRQYVTRFLRASLPPASTPVRARREISERRSAAAPAIRSPDSRLARAPARQAPGPARTGTGGSRRAAHDRLAAP